MIAYYVAFGPHGPRAPTSAPGDGVKIFLATSALVGVAGVLYLVIQQFGMSLSLFYLHILFAYPNLFFLLLCVVFIAAPPPKTLTKEWQEASNERAKEMNLNPITGM